MGARGRGEDAAAAEAARRAAQVSHAELVAKARRDEGPISIGGAYERKFSGWNCKKMDASVSRNCRDCLLKMVVNFTTVCRMGASFVAFGTTTATTTASCCKQR